MSMSQPPRATGSSVRRHSYAELYPTHRQASQSVGWFWTRRIRQTFCHIEKPPQSQRCPPAV